MIYCEKPITNNNKSLNKLKYLIKKYKSSVTRKYIFVSRGP